MSKTVRVDDETYRKLSEYAGELQSKLKRPVSINEAIRYLTREIPVNNRISDLSGTWKTTDEEIEEIMTDLRRGWEKWRPS
jgi:predicted transcriptional regulator